MSYYLITFRSRNKKNRPLIDLIEADHNLHGPWTRIRSMASSYEGGLEGHLDKRYSNYNQSSLTFSVEPGKLIHFLVDRTDWPGASTIIQISTEDFKDLQEVPYMDLPLYVSFEHCFARFESILKGMV